MDGPVLTTPPPELTSTRTSYNAEVSGTLIYDSTKNCLYLEDGQVRFPVIWPGGAEWLNDPPGVWFPDGQTAEPGMFVRGGGGGFDLDYVKGIAGPEVAAAAEACGGHDTSVQVFNIGEAAELQVVHD